MTEALIRGTLYYNSLFTADAVTPGDDPTFRATVIADPDNDWPTINAAIEEASAAKFGVNKPVNWDGPWRDAAPKGFPGQWMINSKANPNYPPEVYSPYADAAGKVMRLDNPSAVFPGCKVMLLVNFYGYSNKGKNGVGTGLLGLQVLDNRPELRIAVGRSVDVGAQFQAVPNAPVQLAPTAFSGQQAGPAGGHPGNAPSGPATHGPSAGAPGTATSPSSGPGVGPGAPGGYPSGSYPSAGPR